MSRDTSKRPEQARANGLPTEGYVLQVDGKMKTRYDTAETAMAAATKLKRSFPVIQIKIYDAVKATYTLVEGQEAKEPAKASAKPAAEK
jgi:hypothetical protein